VAPAYFGHATFSDFTIFEHATFYDYTRFSAATFCDLTIFEHAIFSADTLFDHVTFKQSDWRHTTFSNATFSKRANFKDAAFAQQARFHGTTFSGDAEFLRATFSKEADFSVVIFSGDAAFSNATFSKETDGATLSKEADFSGAIPSVDAYFIETTLSKEADFSGATFSGDAEFHGTIFGRATQFKGVTVEAKIGFVNAVMKGPASFELAKFKGRPPRFFGAQLHEGTVWRYVRWPLPQSRFDAGEYVDAYERLKLEMDRLKKHEDELHFFALELQSRRVLRGSIPIAIYGVLCNYGRSYFLPLGWLLVTIVIGTALFLPHFGLAKYPQAVGLSLANTFGVLGFRKDFIDPNTIEALSHILKVVSAVQTVAGIVLLFCFALAVRNRFRMK
jgi:uncharacterized protein YjbI with pentapeptide repeats